MHSKALLRFQLRSLLASIAPLERAAYGAAVSSALLARPEFLKAQSILFYLPLKDEFDLTECAVQARASGKTVAVPRFDSAAAGYVAARLDCLPSELPKGHFGIPEPPPNCAIVPLNRLDFIVVPGLAFDPAGRRLGRGKGYYDRLLSQITGVKCGVALDAQVLPELPSEPHDMTVDFILTPSRWLDARPGA